MEDWQWGIVFKPLAGIFLISLGLYLRWLINRFMPEGRLKNIILKHRWGPKDSLSR